MRKAQSCWSLWILVTLCWNSNYMEPTKWVGEESVDSWSRISYRFRFLYRLFQDVSVYCKKLLSWISLTTINRPKQFYSTHRLDSLLVALIKGSPYYMKHSYLQLSLLGCGIGVGSAWATRGTENYEKKMTSFINGMLRYLVWSKTNSTNCRIGN